MVLRQLPVPGRPTIWITVGQGPTALVVGADGSCLDVFTLIYPFLSSFSLSWETARYRLKYCLKGPLNPKQPTNQATFSSEALTTFRSLVISPLGPSFQSKYCMLLIHSDMLSIHSLFYFASLHADDKP